MIQNLSITNFQSHKKTELEFSPGVNVITGVSDSGKSSIFRALLWVLNNRPSGDSIKNWHSQERDKTKVTITFSEGEIEKERVKGKSTYWLKENDATTKFDALKQEVPYEVSLLANFTDCNIQTQHETYFLLNESSGEVARKLNEIVGLDIIDTIFKNLDKRIRSVSSSVKVYNETIMQLESDISKIEYADKMYDEVLLLQEKQNYATSKEKELKTLQSICDQLDNLEGVIVEANNIVKAEKKTLSLIEAIKSCNDKWDESVALNVLANKLDSLEELIKIENEWLECEPNSAILQGKLLDFKNRKASIDSVKTLLVQIDDVTNKIEREGYEISAYKEEYADLLKKVKICPICKSKISDKIITEVVVSL